jgi:autotransporter-associated beta strand protein
MHRSNKTMRQRLAILLLIILPLALLLFSGLAEAAPWSFAVIGDQRDATGDAGINTPVVQAMANDIYQNQGVTLVLCGGDQIHGIYGSPPLTLAEMYQNWRTAMTPLLYISYPVRGNHETYGEISDPYYPYFWDNCMVKFLPQIPLNGPAEEKGMTFSFSNQNAFFIGMDEFMPDYGNRLNQNWLDEQLAANILPHVFVYGHLPAVSVSSTLNSLAYYPLNRDAFWKSIAAGGGQVYLCGHSHLYNRATVTITDVNGDTTPPLTQLIVGGGGGPLEPSWNGIYHPYQSGAHQPIPPAPEQVVTTLGNHLENQYSYAVVTVNGNQISINCYAGLPVASVPTSWEITDTFSYVVTSKTLGLNDVNQQMTPEILTDFYPGITINKIGTGTLTLGPGDSSYSGLITVSGGKMRVYGNYGSAPVAVNGGGMTAMHGGSLNQVTSDTGGNLEGIGTINGTLTNNGSISPGFYTGPWNLGATGSYIQNDAGTLKINVASATEYGQLQITGSPGTANLNGAISVDLQNDFVPAVNHIFPNIITASNGLSGTFSKIIVSPETPNLNWQPIYTATSFGLKAAPKTIVPQLYLLLLQD